MAHRHQHPVRIDGQGRQRPREPVAPVGHQCSVCGINSGVSTICGSCLSKGETGEAQRVVGVCAICGRPIERGVRAYGPAGVNRTRCAAHQRRPTPKVPDPWDFMGDK